MYITGTYDTRWNNDVLNPAFAGLTASDFEVITRTPKTPTATKTPRTPTPTKISSPTKTPSPTRTPTP